MLFEFDEHVFESEKERNLYCKFFAGYLFNEYIYGVDERVKSFCKILNDTNIHGLNSKKQCVTLDAKTAHVSFDNHSYLFDEIITDRGEFADILILDRASRTIVAIEAKVHEDWSHEKDIKRNWARIKKIQEKLPTATIIPVLLIKRGKWQEAEKIQNHRGSNYRRFLEESGNAYRLVFWESVINGIEDQVAQYVKSYLNHPPNEAKYRFVDDWFTRKSLPRDMGT